MQSQIKQTIIWKKAELCIRKNIQKYELFALFHTLSVSHLVLFFLLIIYDFHFCGRWNASQSRRQIKVMSK